MYVKPINDIHKCKDKYSDIISEFRLIGYSEEDIDRIIIHALKYYKHIDMVMLSAIMFDRAFIVNKLNEGCTKEEAIEMLYEERPILE